VIPSIAPYSVKEEHLDPRFVLKVNRSLTGRSWISRPVNDVTARAIRDHFDLPYLISRMMAARGVALKDTPSFLDPTLKTLMPNPNVLCSMDVAARRLADAIVKSEKIGVIADYDVDGAVSGALLALYLRSLGQDITVHIPDRIVEGYGPSRTALEQLVKDGATLIITADCGISSGDVFEVINGQADIIVLDHHPQNGELPDVHAIVNPNREDDVSGLGYLAAAGVVFLTLVAVNRELRAHDMALDTAHFMDYLPLVALATVCDVVPLVGLNRVLTVQGLKLMERRKNFGLSALADQAGLSSIPNSYHLGYVLGPRINAGGRIGQSDLGFKLLTSISEVDAQFLAEQLDQLNKERQSMEAKALDEAIQIVEMQKTVFEHVIVVSSSKWHPGIVGLVAARLVEHFQRPAVAIGFDVFNVGRGSCRSLPGFDIGKAISVAANSAIIEKGGGHAMAAGLSLSIEQIEPLLAYLSVYFSDIGKTTPIQSHLSVDGPLSAGGVTNELMSMIERVGPFGNGHPEPRFAFPSHRVTYPKVVGSGHIRVRLKTEDHSTLDAIAFRASGTPLGDALLRSGQSTLHIAGKLKRNSWQGRETIQLIIDDAAFPR